MAARDKRRRQRKKDMKRNGQMIPGVPAFQEGGILTSPPPSFGGPGDLIGPPAPGQPGNVTPSTFGDDPAALANLQRLADAFGVPVQTIISVQSAIDAGVMTTTQAFNILTGQDGGGGGGGPDPFSQNIALQGLDLDRRAQADRERLTDLQQIRDRNANEIARMAQDLDAFVAGGNLTLAKQTEERIARLEQQRLNIDNFIAQTTAAINARAQELAENRFDLNAEIQRGQLSLMVDQFAHQQLIELGQLDLANRVEDRLLQEMQLQG